VKVRSLLQDFTIVTMLCQSLLIGVAIGVIASASAYTPKLNAAGEELRLIKTSDTDNGTWYTEQEKLDLFISTPSCAHFMDITETQVSRILPYEYIFKV
jgi:leucyl aminopeptidase